MTWGWDVSTINPTNFRDGSGFLGQIMDWYIDPSMNGFCLFMGSAFLFSGLQNTTHTTPKPHPWRVPSR